MPPSDPRDLARRQKPASGSVEDYLPPEDVDPDGPSQADLDRFGEVTVKCPECGTELFDDVEICWKCGRALNAKTPDETRPPTWIIVVVIALVLALVGYFVL